jgi:hypothetical protein
VSLSSIVSKKSVPAASLVKFVDHLRARVGVDRARSDVPLLHRGHQRHAHRVRRPDLFQELRRVNRCPSEADHRAQRCRARATAPSNTRRSASPVTSSMTSKARPGWLPATPARAVSARPARRRSAISRHRTQMGSRRSQHSEHVSPQWMQRRRDRLPLRRHRSERLPQRLQRRHADTGTTPHQGVRTSSGRTRHGRIKHCGLPAPSHRRPRAGDRACASTMPSTSDARPGGAQHDRPSREPTRTLSVGDGHHLTHRNILALGLDVQHRETTYQESLKRIRQPADVGRSGVVHAPKRSSTPLRLSIERTRHDHHHRNRSTVPAMMVLTHRTRCRFRRAAGFPCRMFLRPSASPSPPPSERHRDDTIASRDPCRNPATAAALDDVADCMVDRSRRKYPNSPGHLIWVISPESPAALRSAH